MIIDVTTLNSIYNPLGLQGSGTHHRLGMRSYPKCELDLYSLIEHLDIYSSTFCSSYGDITEWSFKDALVKLLNETDNSSTVHTYGQSHLGLSNPNTLCIFDIDGLKTGGKLFLGFDYKKFLYTLEKTSCKIIIVYHKFMHNAHEIPILQEICKDRNIEIQIKEYTDSFEYPIVDEKGNWLYDLQQYVEGQTNYAVHRSINSYQFLCYFANPIEDKDFMHNVTTRNISNLNKTDFEYVSPTGHVFDSSEEYAIFMSFLGKDFKQNETKFQHDKSLKYYGLFTKKYLDNKKYIKVQLIP